jgi:hypothetical protein
MAATPWATLEHVTAVTGKTVDEATLTLAVIGIELKTGLIQEVERTDISGRDRYWLKLAVCFQAAWLPDQPDYLERLAVMTASQDGQTATGAHADWLELAPNARTAIKRLSWAGIRTSSAQGTKSRVVNINDDEYEDTLTGWKPV